MSWVKVTLAGLEKGANVKIRPSGGAMRGRIESGQVNRCAISTLYPEYLNDLSVRLCR